ncbi:unnamed protein product, partial [Onchocerca flexuosa]|uniref:LAM_G_DOMAIN domain-containing protein n=1 Tax=Onchocerca flexuosa TaxID=387005 RepID=A0A183I674_9BILA
MLYYGFLYLTVLHSFLNAQIEIPAQVVTLLDKKSYVQYEFIDWNYQDDGSQLILPIRFRTRTIDGRLITLSVQGVEETLFILSVNIDNAAIFVDLTDGQGKLIKKTKKQLPGANNGKEYSISIQLNVENKMLKIIYGEGTIDQYDFIDDIKFEKYMQLGITTGSYGNFSVFNLQNLIKLLS